MALFKCPECANQISDKAKSCPNCGYQPTTKDVEKQTIKKKSSAGIGCLIVAVVFLIIVFLIPNDDSQSDTPPNTDITEQTKNNQKSTSSDELLAYNYAEEFVSEKLKSPSTAEFPGLFTKKDHITKTGTNEYKIVSWVDSQNSFGSQIRTKFACTILFDGDVVKCTSLDFY